MPGIFGLVGFPASHVTFSLDVMLHTMLHEPFYCSGICTSDSLASGAGWVCHPGSFADCQPLWNRQRNLCLVFAGQCFDSDPLSLNGNGSGHCHGGLDASHLLAHYEKSGLSFLEKLNGWFSGFLMDLRQGKVFLFNDRYGLGRIYWHRSTAGFYFASEAKALLKVLPQLATLDYCSLAEQFSCGCVLQDRTLFKDIYLLPPGSLWTFCSNGSIQKSRLFNVQSWEQQPPLQNGDYDSALQEIFPRILSRYLQGPQPLAMSLTGGLDGRMIMSSLPSGSKTFPCYTFGGMFRDCADVKLARRIARSCGRTHDVLRVNEDFLSQFRELATKTVFISDGAMDVTGAVELYVNRLARKKAPVRLTGNYGSEILRANVAFRPRCCADELFNKEFSQSLDLAASNYAEERSVPRLSFIAFKQVPWHHYSRLSIEQSQLELRSPFLDNDLVALAFRAPAATLDSPNPTLRLISRSNPALAQLPTDRGLRFQQKSLLSRAGRAWQETTVRAEYAYDYGMPQWLAKIDHAFSPLHLERLFLGRHKFYHFRVWYRDQLASFMREVLLDSRSLSRPYLNRSTVEKIAEDHTSGKRNHTEAIHKLLTAELTHRELLERNLPLLGEGARVRETISATRISTEKEHWLPLNRGS